MIKKICIIGLVLILIASLCLGAKSCIGRSGNKTKIGSSIPEWSLPAPSGLIATAVSTSQIDLTWQDNSNNEDGFEIEFYQGGTTQYSLLATVSANTTSYSDAGLTPSTTYYYRVRAYNTILDRSDYSNEASATTLNLEWSVIAAGGNHTLALTTDRTIWTCGLNDFGQLGIGDTDINNISIPTLIASDFSGIEFKGIDIISAGAYHSIAKKTNGSIWAWGANGYGQLGLGDNFIAEAPLQIGTDTDWVSVTAGGPYSLACKTNNTLWGWGRNERGQLGLGDINDRNTPTQIGTDTDWRDVSAGYSHTIACKTNSTIWAWGINSSGQLGLGDANKRTTPSQIGNDSDWSIVTAASNYTIAMKINNTIWAWGNNNYGQLGLGDTTGRNTPSQIGTDSDWSKIAAKGTTVNLIIGHTLAIKTDKKLWTWGYNYDGQLGLDDTINRNTPTLVGE